YISIAVAVALSIASVRCVCQNFNWYQSRHPVLSG
ncbi:hypothetical protein A2U01_0119198, partial [Trifolium medium]|nr:hypothetical protein [Trifolium medium]